MNGGADYERARKRVQELKGFYTHLLVYLLVNLGLFLMNVLRSSDELWFFWSLFGWGVGLVAHAVSVFGVGWVFGRAWEERKIAEIVAKSNKHSDGGTQAP